MTLKYGLLLLSLTLLGCNGGSGGGSSSKPSEGSKSENSTVIDTPEEIKELAINSSSLVTLKSDLSNLDQYTRDMDTFKINAISVKGNFSGHKLTCVNFSAKNKVIENDFSADGKEAILVIKLESPNFDPEDYHCSVKGEGFSKEQTFKLKKSLIVNSPVKLASLKVKDSSNFDLENLVLLEKAELLFEDRIVKIKTKNLISSRGRIVSYSERSQADNNQAGQNGGDLNLKTSNASGELKIELRGQNAGLQLEIPVAKNSIPATPSHLNGKCQMNETNDNHRCEGKKGLPGEEGSKGKNGLNGGDTGRVTFETKSLENLKLKVSFHPGLGSQGGEGGLGGQGGRGGIGSTVRYRDDRGGGPGCAVCSVETMESPSADKVVKYADGPNGEQGPQGPAGDPGLDGSIADSYIQETESGEEIQINSDWEN